MNETQFWLLIESAWRAVGGYEEPRHQLATGQLTEEQAWKAMRTLEGELEKVIPNLRAQLDQLSADELLAFDRLLERKLYDIDRADIQEATDGSDDGFLYARGCIVALGKEYYDAVNADPAKAVMDMEYEEMCYLSFHLYEEKFGALPPSDISRGTCSNAAGWNFAA